MPSTSEGYAPSGLAPNSAVSRAELDPFQFDQQTAEIFLFRLNRELGIAPSTPLEESLREVRARCDALNLARQARADAWKYFHTRFQGLACGLGGTWVQACDEINAYIRGLQGLIAELRAQLDQPTVVPEVSEGPRLAQRVGDPLKTDRAVLIELVPSLIERIKRLEARAEAEDITRKNGA